MNQTRVLLMIAWLFVAAMLWMEWGRFNAPKAVAAPPAASSVVAANTADTVPAAIPATAAVTLVSACSGHGFKHAAAVGEAVAQLVASGAPAAPDGFTPPAQEPRP